MWSSVFLSWFIDGCTLLFTIRVHSQPERFHSNILPSSTTNHSHINQQQESNEVSKANKEDQLRRKKKAALRTVEGRTPATSTTSKYLYDIADQLLSIGNRRKGREKVPTNSRNYKQHKTNIYQILVPPTFQHPDTVPATISGKHVNNRTSVLSVFPFWV